MMKKKGNHREQQQHITTRIHMRKVNWMSGSADSRRGVQTYVVSPHDNYHNSSRKIGSSQLNTRKIKNIGSLLQSIMCPKFNQLFLAFATLLFFFSFEIFLYTIVTISPGLIGRSFELAHCRVINKIVNGNTTCYVESLGNHGSVRVFPCLQIYVKPMLKESTENQAAMQKSRIHSEVVRTPKETETGRNVATASKKVFESALPLRNCERNCNHAKTNSNSSILLLYQNEYNFAGLDHIYRRCSFLPSFCPNDLQSLLSDVCSHSHLIGDVNSTIECYYDQNKDRVIYEKKITQADVAHALLWPLLGIIISVSCCIGFWKRNHKHISRLYIYNSWSAT